MAGCCRDSDYALPLCSKSTPRTLGKWQTVSMTRVLLIESRQTLQNELQLLLTDINMFDHPPVEHHGRNVSASALFLNLIDAIENNALFA